MEARSYTVGYLNLLMMPAIFITSVCSVSQAPLKQFEYGTYILSGLNAFLTFILAVVSFMKLDASAQAYNISSHQYDSLQTYVESMKRDQYMSMPSELTWAFGGYGPIAFYQSDFNGLDAFNLERFGTSHGFEDTDIAYRIYSCNLLMIRDPVYDFVHLPHVTNSWGKDDVID